MSRAFALVLVWATIASGLNVKQVPETVHLQERLEEETMGDLWEPMPDKQPVTLHKEPIISDFGDFAPAKVDLKAKYAYVTMWVVAAEAPKFVKRDALMTAAEEKAQLKAMQAEEGLDEVDPAVYKLKMSQNLEQDLGGQEMAHMGTLRLAQQLKTLGSKYPLVLLTNDPKLLAIDHNDTKRSLYPNVVIKPIHQGDWLKQQCKLKPGNGLHYQKLSIFGMTDYDKLMWIDTDMTLRKNLDGIFDDPRYDLLDGKRIYGQRDDYFSCDGKGDFCSSLMLFKPRADAIEGLGQAAKGMGYCWGDQRIIRQYFKTDGRSKEHFSHNVVHWSHCNWKKSDPMAVHNQKPADAAAVAAKERR